MKQLALRAAPAVAGVVFLIGLGALAQEARLSKSDERFVMKAAKGNLFEIEVGRVAMKNGTGAAVKDFAQRLVRDHTKALEKLRKVAARHGVELPAELSAKEREQFRHLSKLEGARFDEAFAKDMVKDHEKDVAEFQREAKEVQAPDLREWTRETLPVLEEHLRLARKLRAEER